MANTADSLTVAGVNSKVMYNIRDSWHGDIINYNQELPYNNTPWYRSHVAIDWETRPAKWQDLGISSTTKWVFDDYMEAKDAGTLNTFLKDNSTYQEKWLDKVMARRYVVRYSGYKVSDGQTVDHNLVNKVIADDSALADPVFFIEGDDDEGMTTTSNTTVTGFQIIPQQDGLVENKSK